MEIHVRPTKLEGVVVVETEFFRDERGFFIENYHKQRYAEHGIREEFVQDNHSRSSRGVLRGLHYQILQPQGKLIQVMAGEIFDVAVDLRRSSPTFGKWIGVTLAGGSHRMLWVPQGFAHGYIVLSEHAIVFYKTTDFYAPEHERTILWNDETLAIRWPLEGEPIVSDKDRRAPPFRSADLFD